MKAQILHYMKYELCIQSTFINPMKSFFLNKKYFVPIQNCTTQFENSMCLLQIRFLKITVEEKLLHISTCAALTRYKRLEIHPHTHTNI